MDITVILLDRAVRKGSDEMKKKTRNVLIIAIVLAAMTITTFIALATNQTAESSDIAVSYNSSAGTGTVTIDPSKWDIPVGKAVTLLILKPGSSSDNVNPSDIVWIDEAKVANAGNLVFSFKLRTPAPGQYIVKVGGFEADPVVSHFNVS